MQYQINIAIDGAGLRKIYGVHQSVALVKKIDGFVAAVEQDDSFDLSSVVWLSFRPLQENQLVWVENYDLYATTTALTLGAAIAISAKTNAPVQPGMLYTFKQGQFYPGTGSGSAYNVANQMAAGNFSFGLAQQAIINGVSTLAPLNASPVLYNQQASFTPEETISIFLASCSANGTYIGQIDGSALTITLSSQNPRVDLGFDDSTNSFYIA
jgi:hypothetical protein